ncbi:MAG: PEP-CTERM sorting domain-containing protein [Phycisphaerae bacterium]|nr:PEP-CTERM sorting domain-containing protein [Phycisphaerae bacterium]
MKTAMVILAIAAVAVFTSTASAHNYVWWEATDGVASYGGKGQLLNLPCPGIYEVSMWLYSDEALYGWASDLTSDMPGCPLISNFDYDLWIHRGKCPPYYYPFETVNWGITLGPGFITNAGGSTWSHAPPSDENPYYPNGYRLCRFTLECTPDCCGAILTEKTGLGGWVGANPEVMVQFGDNPVRDAALPLSQGGWVIACDIPEPATITLLGLAGLVMIRRRR